MLDVWGWQKGRLAARTEADHRPEMSMRTTDGSLCYVECKVVGLVYCWTGFLCRLEASNGFSNVVSGSSTGKVLGSPRS